ncbi:MAG TPA: hypothetical protein VH257_03835, partial [Chloroflexota bacterium]|nr:hypothetical protein [Chloroflexota bacterium]
MTLPPDDTPSGPPHAATGRRPYGVAGWIMNFLRGAVPPEPPGRGSSWAPVLAALGAGGAVLLALLVGAGGALLAAGAAGGVGFGLWRVGLAAGRRGGRDAFAAGALGVVPLLPWLAGWPLTLQAVLDPLARG